MKPSFNDDCTNFEELWANEEKRELMKELVIARLKQIPDNFRLCIGGNYD